MAVGTIPAATNLNDWCCTSRMIAEITATARAASKAG
jgi:hypothetical protein